MGIHNASELLGLHQRRQMTVVLGDHQHRGAHLLSQVVDGDALQQALGSVVVAQAVQAALFAGHWAVQQLNVFQPLAKGLVPVIRNGAIRQSKQGLGYPFLENLFQAKARKVWTQLAQSFQQQPATVVGDEVARTAFAPL